MNKGIILDELDRKILQALQLDGRMTYDQLAEKVQLSPSAALRRVRKLEESGVIGAYVALIEQDHVGLGLTAYVHVRIQRPGIAPGPDPMERFRADVQNWPEVTQCASLTGEMDYLLRVVVGDMGEYSRFMLQKLLKHPSVQDCTTSFVMDWVKDTTALPL